MSTRCNIIVKDKFKAIQLYRHSDGYPDSKHGVVETLKKALPFSWKLPRMEAGDFAAAIIRAWKTHAGNIYIDGSANMPESLHGDIEYLYIISPDENKGKWSLEVLHMEFTGPPSFDAKPGKTLFRGHIGDDY